MKLGHGGEFRLEHSRETLGISECWRWNMTVAQDANQTGKAEGVEDRDACESPREYIARVLL